MGADCSIPEAEARADADAYWTEEQPCRCSRQYSFTTSLQLEVVPITIYCCCCKWERAREVVQANIRCDLCGRQFRRTYEMRYHEKRKQKRSGYYGKRIEVIAQSAGRFSIADLEECYALPFYPYGLNVRRHPNEHWAEDFYQQLVTVGELNRAHRM